MDLPGNHKISAVLILITAFVLGIVLNLSDVFDSQDSERSNIEGLLWPNPKQLRPFATVDQDDQIFGLDDFQGQWSFVFFGYTHCPDVCPLTMTIMKHLKQRLGQSRPDIQHQVIFVSVDSDRDTTEKLKEYIEYFDPDFVGLGGNSYQIQSLAGQIGVAYFLQEANDDGQYLVDHSASIFMIDPNGRLAGVLSAPHEQNNLYNKAVQIIDFVNQKSATDA